MALRRLTAPAIALALSIAVAMDLNAQVPSAPLLVPLSIPKEVRLHSLAVDIKLHEEPLSAEFSASYRFENTSKLEARAFSVRASFPDSIEKPVLKRGKEVLGVKEPVEITLEPGSKEVLTLQCTLPLTGYPLITLSYPLPVDFARSIDSIRVTVHLPYLMDQAELVEAEPGGFEFDGFRLTWRWIKEPFPPEIRLSLLAPSLQRRLRELKGKADALSLYETGTIYRSLAMALPAGSEAGERFYREAIAYLERARSADPTLYQVSLDLAALYYHRAFRPDGSADPPTLALAAREIERAVEAGAPEGNLAWTLQSIYLTLSRELQGESSYREAISYLEKAMALAEKGHPVPSGAGEVARLRRDLSALLAVRLMEEGEYRQAISLINEVFGRDFWEMLGVKLPLCRSTRAQVKLKPGSGELVCSCASGPLYNPSDPDLASLALEGSDRLVIRVDFPLGEMHAPEREEIAARFPVRSDFALCIVPLKASATEWSERAEFLGKRLFIEGEVDTSEALNLMELELATLRKRGKELASEEVLESEAVQELALKLLETGARELEALRLNSSLELELDAGGTEQEWLIKPGEKISFQREFRELYPWVKPVVFLLALTAVSLLIILLGKLRMSS